MFIFETEVFQFRLDLIQSQAIGKRGVNIKGFACNLILLVGQHGTECTHVVQAVGNLDQDHPDIIRHGEQEFLEVFCLCRSPVTKNTSGDFGQSVDNLCNLGPEDIFDIFYCIIGVLDNIVQQSGTNGSRAKAYFIAYDLRDGNGVHDIRFPRASFDAFMCLIGEIEGLGYNLNTFAVLGSKIIVQQFLKRLFNHLLFSYFFLVLSVHNLVLSFLFCKNNQI